MSACPNCGEELVRVIPPSSLNRDQWDSVKAGDFYCKTCPPNTCAKSGLCYFDIEDLLPRENAEDAKDKQIREQADRIEALEAELDGGHSAIFPYVSDLDESLPDLIIGLGMRYDMRGKTISKLRTKLTTAEAVVEAARVVREWVAGGSLCELDPPYLKLWDALSAYDAANGADDE